MGDSDTRAMAEPAVDPAADAAATDTAAAMEGDVTEGAAMPVAPSLARTDASDAAPTSAIADAAPAMEQSTAPVTALTPEIRWHCGPTGLNEAVLSIDFLHPRCSASPLQSVISSQSPPSSQSPSLSCESSQPTPQSETPQPTILATGGADKEIKLWRVRDDLHDHAGLEFVFSLSGHDRSVNCVRFSPNGEWLASASDDSTVILWTKPKTAAADWAWDTIASFSDVARTLLACGHKGDITDLAWSPDSAFLCSTSVDNTCVIWSAERGEVEERRKDHTQYVQGAAWDPLNEFLATEGNDRACRVYALQGFDAASRTGAKKVPKKCVCVQTLKTREFPVVRAINSGAGSDASSTGGADAAAQQTATAASQDVTPPDSTTKPTAVATAEPAAPKHRMFLDDTCPAFARRPTWTPDGSYLLAPTGTFRASEAAAPVHTVYAFARGNLSTPTLHLPGHDKASLGVRCNPLLYKLRRDANGDGAPPHNFFQTPHRAVFAVITLNAVAIYDTQHPHPLVTLKDLHYADLTDVSWSRDGRLLGISSMDGYLSFIKFADGFFGAPVPPSEQAAMNKQQMQRMFAAPKLARKKLKAAAAATSATPDDANGTNKTTATATSAVGSAKKKPKVSTLVARKKSDTKAPVETAAAAPVTVAVAPIAAVHTLQVRKKRKIAPVLVPPTAVIPATPVVVPVAAVAVATANEDAEMESDSSVGEPILL